MDVEGANGDDNCRAALSSPATGGVVTATVKVAVASAATVTLDGVTVPKGCQVWAVASKAIADDGGELPS